MTPLAAVLAKLQGTITPQFDDPLSRALTPLLLGGWEPRSVERGTVHKMDPRQTPAERYGTISPQPPPVDLLARATGGGQGLPWMAGLAMEAGFDPGTAHQIDALAGILGQAMEAKAAKGTASSSAIAGARARASMGRPRKSVVPQDDERAAILRAIGDDEYGLWGLRVTGEDDAKVGSILGPSREYDNDELTGNYLGGTSTVGVTRDNIEDALRIVKRYGSKGNPILLVRASSTAPGGVYLDEGESVLRDPEVVAILGRRE